MIDLSKLSVGFSVKIDSPDRLRNLSLVLRYFQTFFHGYEIIIIEQAHDEGQCHTLAGPGIRHVLLKTADCHYKTRNLNVAASLSTRPYLMMCDADTFVPPDALKDAVGRLDEGVAFVSPYNGIFAEVDQRLIHSDLDFEELLKVLPHFSKTYDLHPERYDFTLARPLHGNINSDATGGVLLYRKEPFVLIGGWNENFISYGFQDMEMHMRIKRLGYKLEKLSKYNCYHIPHERTVDSRYNNFQSINQNEYEKVSTMPVELLAEYGIRGFRDISLDAIHEYRLVNNQAQYNFCKLDNDKYDLTKLSTVFAVTLKESRMVVGFLNILEYMEQYFNNYDIIVVEVGTRNFKYLPNRKNVCYRWLPHGHSVDEAVSCGLGLSRRELVDVHILNQVIDAASILAKYSELLQQDRDCYESAFVVRDAVC
jgi:hypothetical protein